MGAADQSRTPRPGASEGAPGRRVSVSTRCNEEVWNRARAVAVGMVSEDPRFTLSDLIEQALVRECDRLEAEHGGPWPEVSGDLRRGRRIG